MKIVVVVFGVFGLCCLASFLTFDSILRRLYEVHYGDWLNERRPYGFFYRPEGTPSFYTADGLKSWFALQRLRVSLTFRTPNWARNNGQLSKFLLRYRVLGVVSVLVWLVFAYCAIYQL